MFLCWSTVLPVLPSILHIPSIGELLANSTRQGWLSGTGRSYLWHHPDSGCPWTWMPMDIPSRFRNQFKITSEVWTTTAQRALNKEISGIKRHPICMHCIHGERLFLLDMLALWGSYFTPSTFSNLLNELNKLNKKLKREIFQHNDSTCYFYGSNLVFIWPLLSKYGAPGGRPRRPKDSLYSVHAQCWPRPIYH